MTLRKVRQDSEKSFFASWDPAAFIIKLIIRAENFRSLRIRWLILYN